jgi:hypothetical protein
MRLFNEAYKNKIFDEQGVSLSAVPVGAGIVHHDIVAEVTYHIARLAHEKAISFASATKDGLIQNLAISAVAMEMNQFELGAVSELKLNDAEWEEVRSLCYIYEGFLRIFQNEGKMEFGPIIPGAGFLGACRADLSIGSTLFEIKTVTRNIAGKDLRQLIIYLALQSSTGKRRWVSAGFFNPRKALYYHFAVDQIISIISGRRATTEVFREIIDFLTSRDIQLDTAF